MASWLQSAAAPHSFRLVITTAMQLPHVQTAVISESKIADYLLNPQHPDGAGKANFFMAAGFQVTRWQELADAIREAAKQSPVTRQMDSVHGRKYIVEGPIQAPNGGLVSIRTVWIADGSDPTPRFVTAYPIQPKGKS
jgi:hypothetical protein